MMRTIFRIFYAILLSALLSNAASAADFLIYKFNVSGIAKRDVQLSFSNEIHLISLYSGVIEFVVPGNGLISDFNYREILGPTFASDTYTGTFSNSGLRINEFTSMYTKSQSRNFSIGACGNFSGLSAPVTITNDPACSSVDFFRGIPTGQGLAGDAASFTGFVTSFSVTAGFGTPNAYGLINAPVLAIPEPASWAMMLLGFGAVGYSIRRRSNVNTRVRFA